MKTQISGLSFDELKHYLGVFLQMGRVQLDADWNEQSEIWLRLLQRHTDDAVGDGSPNHGFRVDDRILLDALDDRDGWSAEASSGDPQLFVDYFVHRTGTGSLTVEGADAVVRDLEDPLDLSNLEEVVFAVRGTFATGDCVFFLEQSGTRHDLTTTEDPDTVAGWRIFRADPASLPSAFDLSAVDAYGFRQLDSTRRYSFDFIKIDRPIRLVLVPTTSAALFTATPMSAGDVPKLVINDDDRIWRSTVLQATKAGTVRHTLPVVTDLRHARRIVYAARSGTAGAGAGLKLIDADANEASLTAISMTTADTWYVMVADAPPATIDLARIAAIEWTGLSATTLLAPVLIEMDLDDNLVIMGGDGDSEGAGRFYGDGLAAIKERHETYFSQPDLPAADPGPMQAPSAGHCRIDLAYLDLWERPITYMEDPELRDVALAGVDTCTRTQLVAQVRLLKGTEAASAVAAEPPLQDFDDLPCCGNGTLTTKDTPAAVLDPCADPCEPAVAGSYAGTRNRLYRVEIHSYGDIGPAGNANTATFKWSAENAAVASPLLVTAAAGTHSLTVEKPELFQEGDLIEVSDDLVDLITGPYEDTSTHRRHSRGELRRITAINMDDRRISWQDPSPTDPALHAPLSHTYSLVYHAKVRRWCGLSAVTAGDIVIDDGVVIEFGGSGLVPGDYWVFATREADRSVERLIEAPPRGIHHRYFKLATVTRCNVSGTTSVVVDDLRPLFNPLTALEATDVAFDPGRCALRSSEWEEVSNVQEAIEMLCALRGGGLCTATVGDGTISHGQFTSIRAAIDSLAPNGGLVCILRGNHLVRETIDVPSNVIIRGTGAATRIAFVPEPSAFQGLPGSKRPSLFRVRDAHSVRFEDFFAITETGLSLIEIGRARQVTIRGCTLANTRTTPLAEVLSGRDSAGRTVALTGGSAGVTIDSCRLLAAVAVVGSGLRCQDLLLHDVTMRAPLAGLSFVRIQGLEVSGCDIAGIPKKKVPNAIDINNLTQTQAQVENLLNTHGQPGLFGFLALGATNVTFDQTRIVALVGIMPLLGALQTVRGCTISGAVNVWFPFGMVVKVRESTLVGILNVVQAGITIGFEVSSSTLIGLYGVSFCSAAQFLLFALAPLAALAQKQVALSLVASGSASGGKAQPGAGGPFAFGTQMPFITKQLSALGGVLAIGASMMASIRDNLFLSLLGGVTKLNTSLTADMSIGGNRLYFCLQHGLFLGPGTAEFHVFKILSPPGHVVCDNHFWVKGKAIVSKVRETSVQGNQISTPAAAAIELHAAQCDVDGNRIVSSQRAAPKIVGNGIVLAAGVSRINLSRNTIKGGSGNGVLIQGAATGLVIDNNVIEEMNGNGISTATNAVVINSLAVRGNRIFGCVRQPDLAKMWTAGAIVLSDGQRITVSENRIWGNGRGASGVVHGIYGEDLEEAVIQGNQIWDNGSASGGGAAVYIWKAQRDVQVLGNSLQHNGGCALRIAESSSSFLFDYQVFQAVISGPGAMGANEYLAHKQFTIGWSQMLDAFFNYFEGFVFYIPQQSISVSGNTISGTLTRSLVDIDDVERLLFADNRVQGTVPTSGTSAIPVLISANHLIFTGNHVQPAVGAQRPRCVLLSSVGANHKFIISNNILSGSSLQLPPAQSLTVVNANNLFAS